MRWIVSRSLRFRFLVVAAAVALMAFGAASLQHQKLDVFPEFAPTQVQIQTEALGLSASEVEQLVTLPLENALNGVAGVQETRSESVPQLSSITLLFGSGTDLFKARRLVQERLQSVPPTLPTWAATPVLMPPVSATSRIMAVGLTSHRLSSLDLSRLAFWTVRARLLRVPGVANVAIWGERPKQLQVQAEPARMEARRVSLDALMTAANSALDAGLLRFTSGSVVGTGGFVETPSQRIPVRNVLPIARPNQLANVPVAERGSGPVRIGDVSRVVYGTSPLIGDAVVNGGPGLLLVIEKFPGANTLGVTHGVDQALSDLKPGLRGVQVDANIFRPASFIETAIDNLTLAVILGCMLVVGILIAFLYQWRATFVSLVTIPVSLISALLVLSAFGATINTLVLAGLAVAVGVVVDDAIIDVENIVRRMRLRRENGARVSAGAVILAASLEVRVAILYATLINVVAVAPVFFVGDLSGAFFRPLALAYALAVLVSMVVAMTLPPALALILLGRGPPRPDPALARRLKRGYEGLLARNLEAPWPVFGAFVAAVVAAILVLPGLGEDLFPTFKERDFLMHWVTRPGSSLREERRTVTRVGNQVRAIDGVRDLGTHIGQAFLGEEIAGPNFAENWVSVAPSADYDRTVGAIRSVADANPGLYKDVETYFRERVDEVLAGASEPIVVRIFGPDLGGLRREAGKVKRALEDVDGIVALHTEAQSEVPQIEVRVKLGAARRYGLKPGDIRRAEATMVASEDVARIFRGGRVYEVA